MLESDCCGVSCAVAGMALLAFAPCWLPHMGTLTRSRCPHPLVAWLSALVSQYALACLSRCFVGTSSFPPAFYTDTGQLGAQIDSTCPFTQRHFCCGSLLASFCLFFVQKQPSILHQRLLNVPKSRGRCMQRPPHKPSPHSHLEHIRAHTLTLTYPIHDTLEKKSLRLCVPASEKLAPNKYFNIKSPAGNGKKPPLPPKSRKAPIYTKTHAKKQ